MIHIIHRISTQLCTESTYAIYSACMYKPTYPKYIQQMNGYLSDPDILCFGVFDVDELTGIIIVKDGEILGIAVREDMRCKGVGSALIHHAAQQFSTLSAETDDDSVGFYRACGFVCERFERTFPDGISVRYKCTKNNF